MRTFQQNDQLREEAIALRLAGNPRRYEGLRRYLEARASQRAAEFTTVSATAAAKIGELTDPGV